MPTKRNGAVRRWLSDGNAEVVNLCPFTIKLKCNTGNIKQEVIVGLDTGAVNVGCAAISNNEVLFASETKLRTDISDKMQRRSMYRHSRRNRKTRYRQPRFNNRKIKEGWLAPSLKSKLDSTVKIVKNLSKILPISKVVVETAKFDIQKIMNPEITKIEYQNGRQTGYDNLRAFVLHRDNYTCQICKKKEGILNVHHIIQRKDSGSDNPDNLITLHKDCHDKFHSGEIKYKFKKPKQYKAETQVTVLKDFIVNKLKKDFPVETTFGYITKQNRLRLGLSKTHYNDAISICNPNNIIEPKIILKRVCVPRGRYQLTKGVRSERKLPNGKVFGFSQFDKVKLPDNSIGFIKGRRRSGFFDVCNINGNSISHSIKHTKLVKLNSNYGIIENYTKNSILITNLNN